MFLIIIRCCSPFVYTIVPHCIPTIHKKVCTRTVKNTQRFKKIKKIHRNNQVNLPGEDYNFIKKETLAQVKFPVKFPNFLKYSFTEHLWTTASKNETEISSITHEFLILARLNLPKLINQLA